jgi:hypothetical protein
VKIKSSSGHELTITTRPSLLDKKKMNLVWTSGIALASCVPEVTYFKELVQDGVQINSIWRRE